jgi:hypothetical protein
MSFMALIDRSRERRMKIVTNRATSHEEAEMWDLEFWQMMSPEDRLSALVAIRRDIDLVELSRTRTEPGDD